MGRAGKGCGGGKENEGRKGKGRGGEGGEAGSGAQPRRYFLKCVFTLSPGLAEGSRLCFWTPLAEIFLLVKFEQDRSQAERLHETWPSLPYGGWPASWPPPLASYRGGAHVLGTAEFSKFATNCYLAKFCYFFIHQPSRNPGAAPWRGLSLTC